MGTIIQLMAFVIPALSQNYHNMNFENITTKQGLPSNRVNCVAKDSLGFIWYGTTLGLARSDGTTIESFMADPDNSYGLPSNYITKLLVTSSGILWGLTNDGFLFSLNPYSIDGRFIQTHNPGNDHVEVHAITSFGNTVYAAHSDGTIYQSINGENWKKIEYCVQHNMTEPGRYHSIVFHKGSLWIGTDSGFFSLNPDHGELVYYNHLKFINATEIKANDKVILDIAVVSDSLIFLAPDATRSTSYKGILLFNLVKNKFEFLSIGFPKERNSDNHKLEFVRQTGKSDIMLLLREVGAIVYNLKSKVADTIQYRFNEVNKLNTYSIRDFFKDENRLYILTNQGVYYHEPYSYIFKEIYPLKGHFQFRNLWYSYLFENQQKLLMAYSRNLKIYDLKEDALVKTMSIDKGLSDFKTNQITALIPIHNDEILILSDQIYSFRISENKLNLLFPREYLNRITGAENPEIRYPYFRISDSTNKSILHFYRDGFIIPVDLSSKTVIEKNIVSLHQKGIYNTNVLLSVDNDKLLASNGTEKIFVFDIGDNFKKIQEISLESRYKKKPVIRDMIIADDAIWIATQNQGVMVMTKDLRYITSYTIKEGLKTNQIYQLQADLSGRIWLSTQYGVSYIDPCTHTVLNFNKHHGINFPHNMMEGKYMDSKGNIYFSEGIIIAWFNPDEIIKQANPPKIYITDFRINETKRFGLFKDTFLSLKYDENDIYLKFCAMNHVHSYMNKYKYQMEGIDDDWNNVDFQNLDVRYSNLSGGNYTFRVKAANHLGIWNDDGIKIKLKISTPYWQEWWFSAIIILLVLISVISFLSYRNKIKRKREILSIKTEIEAQVRERERIARDLHDDIGAQLSTLKMYISAIQDSTYNPGKLSEYSEASAGIIGNTIQSMSTIINELSPQTLVAYGLNAAIKEFIYYIKNTTDIEFELIIDEFESELDRLSEIALFRIIQELVNNSTKHAQADKITIQIQPLENDRCCFEYNDNGKGFAIEKVKRGNGLTNIKNRAKVLKGFMEIQSDLGQGFRCTIHFQNKSNYNQ